MSSSHNIVRLFLIISIMSTMVVSYSVGPLGDQATGLRFWRPVYERSEYSDDVAPSNDFDDSRMKRGLDDDIEQQLSKRTNLKRLVILSARGFGKK